MQQGTTDETAFRRDERARIHPAPNSGSDHPLGGTPPKPAPCSGTIVEIDAGQRDAGLLQAVTLAIEQGQTFFLSPPQRQGGEPGRSWPEAPAAGADRVSLASFDDPVFGVLSGGTTGAPKRILRSHRSWIRSFLINRRLWDLVPGDTYGILSSVAHSWGLYAALEALSVGADVHLMSEVMPTQQSRVISENAITVLYATPTQLRRLVRQAPTGMESTVRLINVCGSRLDAALGAATQALFPAAHLMEFYGTSETSFISMRAVAMMPKEGSGTVYPGVSVKIDKGKILIQSPLMALGTMVGGDDAADGKIRRPGVRPLNRDAEGFFATGECGHLDEKGHLVIEGRLDRRYTVADINVDPEAIEALLMSLDGVTDAAVYPVSDTTRGSVSHTDVLIDGQTARQTRIKTKCREHLGALLAPREYRFFTDPIAFARAGHARHSLKS